MSPIISSGGGGGGSQTATATVTTDANTFTVEHVVDFAHGAVAFVKFTITAVVPNGETFGVGNLCIIWEDASGFSAAISPDNAAWTAGAGQLTALGKGNDGLTPAYAVNDVGYQAIATPRYLRVPVTIFQADGATPYAGPNHPTVTARIDVEYA